MKSNKSKHSQLTMNDGNTIPHRDTCIYLGNNSSIAYYKCIINRAVNHLYVKINCLFQISHSLSVAHYFIYLTCTLWIFTAVHDGNIMIKIH